MLSGPNSIQRYTALMANESRTDMAKPQFFVLALAVLFAAALTAFSGSGSGLPLNSHDVFVARTAEEMMQRHSFIVPYLNDQPRIKKPPLSYWIVTAVDKLNGSDGVITEFEARLPSIIAGIFMVGLTIALGCVIFSRAAGIIAGLMLAASMGYVNYTHSARPEMLFAMFCTAGVLGFALSDRSHFAGDLRSRWFAWFGWLMMGLAILTKGPQLPLPMIGGWIIAMFISGRRKQVLAAMRPFTGVLIMATVSLWWYFALWKTLPNAWDIWQGETVDKYFSSREPKSRYLDPYYLYRTAQLMLPWAVFFGLGAAAPWLRELKSSIRVRMLWWVILTPMVLLSISLSRRDYYMLPVTGAAAALMAAASVEVGRALWSRQRQGWWTALAAAHVVAIGAALVVLKRIEPEASKPPMWAMVMATIVTACALWLIFRTWRQSRSETAASAPGSWWNPSDLVLSAALATGVAFFAAAAFHESLWDQGRMARRDFSLQLRQIVAREDPLLGWREIWEIDQYNLHRVIPSFSQSETLINAIRQRLSSSERREPAQCWVLVAQRDDPRRPGLTLPKSMAVEVVRSVKDEESGEVMQLWRVTNGP